MLGGTTSQAGVVGHVEQAMRTYLAPFALVLAFSLGCAGFPGRSASSDGPDAPVDRSDEAEPSDDAESSPKNRRGKKRGNKSQRPEREASASTKARAMCDQLAKELDHPCEAHGVGDSVTIDGIEVTIDRVRRWEGKDSLPEIQSLSEREAMEKVGSNTLALEVSLKNTSAVKHGVDSVIYLVDGAGDDRYNVPYNSRLYMKGKNGWADLWEDDQIAPGATRKSVLIYPTPKSAMKGGMLVMRYNVERPDPKDPRGREKVFVEELHVLEVGTPSRS